ncbi:J domain-containing protein [bacterium]|nr:J domain-containing protein [bacterium]
MTSELLQIRKAYRKLAKELHPDLNPGDKSTEDRFKKVSAAHSLLSDAEQRARFDRGEIDGSGAVCEVRHALGRIREQGRVDQT